MDTAILDKLRTLTIRHRQILIAAAIFFVATASFMWPAVTHLSTYSDGGDHMFNAWTMARNHYCLVGQGCPDYSTSNIFFPHKDSMLYSETQLSAGILTLPLFFLNHNPLFSSNIWFFLSTFFCGFFMYVLARYLSKGNQPISILAGLIFEFAPTKLSSADHLQNLSIFYLPLIIWLLLRYRDKGRKKYLAWFAIACSLLFLASWYQMVFGLVVIGLFILYLLTYGPEIRKRALWLIVATFLAILTTLPLAKDYVRFSKANNATFSLNNQIIYSASLNDYAIPNQGTPLGDLYYKWKPGAQVNSYDPDSYSYAGITLYVIALWCLVEIFLKRRGTAQKERNRFNILLWVLAISGFILSLGPVLKIGSRSVFHINSLSVSIAMPYLLVDRYLPQLSFMRALGRASILTLFALCCLLAVFAIRLKSIQPRRTRILVTTLLFLVIAADVLPISLLIHPFEPIDPQTISYSVPPVYKYIDAHKSINDMVVIRSERDYPGAPLPTANAEDILWSGYDNRNIFNGYSGYYPHGYFQTLQTFVNFQPGVVNKMKAVGLKYVLLDKRLSANRPGFEAQMSGAFTKKVYEDKRYALFQI